MTAYDVFMCAFWAFNVLWVLLGAWCVIYMG